MTAQRAAGMEGRRFTLIPPPEEPPVQLLDVARRVGLRAILERAAIREHHRQVEETYAQVWAQVQAVAEVKAELAAVDEGPAPWLELIRAEAARMREALPGWLGREA